MKNLMQKIAIFLTKTIDLLFIDVFPLIIFVIVALRWINTMEPGSDLWFLTLLVILYSPVFRGYSLFKKETLKKLQEAPE